MFLTVAQWDAGFLNAASGDYHLRSSAVFLHAGSGGATPGVNLDILESGDDISVESAPAAAPAPAVRPVADRARRRTVLGDGQSGSVRHRSCVCERQRDDLDVHVAMGRRGRPGRVGRGGSDIHGKWQRATMAGTAGVALVNPNAGATKATSPLASPSSYVDIHFNAGLDVPTMSGFAVRPKAIIPNDSFYMQFSDSVDATGKACWPHGNGHGVGDGSRRGVRRRALRLGLERRKLWPHRESHFLCFVRCAHAARAAARRRHTDRSNRHQLGGVPRQTAGSDAQRQDDCAWHAGPPGVTAIHRYARPGIYPLVLTVVDLAGAQDSDTATVTVR